MNVRTATLLSIAGVLAAGTAAVAVNTQVLSGSDAPVDVPSPLTLPVATQVYTVPGAVDSGQPILIESSPSSGVSPQAATEVVLDVTTPPSSVADATPMTSAPSTSAPTNTLMAFQIGDAAVATVDTAGGVLTIVSVDPSSGWTVAETEGSGSVRIEVEMMSSTTKVEFGAFLSGGEVITSISSESLSVPERHDDDDDDDHDDDDHDDDHDDDDDDHDRGNDDD